jgi:hypothetical protein
MAQDAHYTHAMATHPLLTGSGLAVLSLPLHVVVPAETSVVLASLTLALIAGVYLGFAFSDGRLSVMLTELFVALALHRCRACGSDVLAGLDRCRSRRARPVGLGAPSGARADPHATLVCAVLRRFRLGICGGATRYLVEGGCSAAWINAVSGEFRPSSAALMASTAVIFSRLGVGS